MIDGIREWRMEINKDFIVDFGKEPNGRAALMRPLSWRRLHKRYLAMMTITLSNRNNDSYQVKGRKPLDESWAQEIFQRLPIRPSPVAKLIDGEIDQRGQVARHHRSTTAMIRAWRGPNLIVRWRLA